MSFGTWASSWAGDYAFFILSAYAVSALGLTAAVAWTLGAYARAKARLKALEDKKP